jgi:hypothetical protein
MILPLSVKVVSCRDVIVEAIDLLQGTPYYLSLPTHRRLVNAIGILIVYRCQVRIVLA